jgi:hypothetical protein
MEHGAAALEHDIAGETPKLDPRQNRPYDASPSPIRKHCTSIAGQPPTKTWEAGQQRIKARAIRPRCRSLPSIEPGRRQDLLHYRGRGPRRHGPDPVATARSCPTSCSTPASRLDPMTTSALRRSTQLIPRLLFRPIEGAPLALCTIHSAQFPWRCHLSSPIAHAAFVEFCAPSRFRHMLFPKPQQDRYSIHSLSSIPSLTESRSLLQTT